MNAIWTKTKKKDARKLRDVGEWLIYCLEVGPDDCEDSELGAEYDGIEDESGDEGGGGGTGGCVDRGAVARGAGEEKRGVWGAGKEGRIVHVGSG